MKVTKLFSRVSRTSQSAYDGPARRLFWRPSRWFPTRSFANTSLASKFNTRFLYRFQRRNLIEYTDKQNFGSSSRWYRKSNLSKWTKNSLRWTPIPIVVGVIWLVYRQLLTANRRNASEDAKNDTGADVHDVGKYSRRALPWQVPTVFYVYQFLPLRALSRTWGWVNDLYLPPWLRRPLLSSYVWLFGVDLSEAAIQDLKWYKNLGEFFRRHLRPGVRPVADKSCVVSPSDGTVLHVGRVEDDCVEQVKGMTYSLAAFLGPKNWFTYTADDEPVVEENEAPEPSKTYRKSLCLRNKGTDLYHCVIYLAPGDYHRFHSPADWQVISRRHFPGHLFSVSPSITKRIEGLFNYNERVVYYGNWLHGFFSMTAVGATNVGSIRVYFDERLKTNNRRYKRGAYQDWNFSQHMASSADVRAVDLVKGAEFGEFNLGSTIVLLFEAPKNFEFTVDVGDKVFYGRPLGCLMDGENPVDTVPACRPA
ncbi:phosphatidylserine decarboxylase proenzyme, mitochondrial-like [Paramacrobiotus metropolitanus]|uniref:phosphatidylserine decarboxylase proenzyme, mitochondrial-like n=1 Tax=Paramacrobiotus metropolitanus TaxID=2943436 RepID=UPI0024461527|nr:phosphatidylserine decarboxylase proenzyme, mitochondrial-like [Paramacrobiotus metropolitanus]